MTKTKKAKKSERKKPSGAKFMGEIFEKYPKVRSITWDQHEGLDGLFYVESAGVLVNGKSLDDGGKLSDQERAAVIELEGLIAMALGGDNSLAGIGTVDQTTLTAINTSNLLRAIFGNNVNVTVNRDGSVKREPSWGRSGDEYLAEDEVQEKAFRGHVSGCAQCKATISDSEQVMNLSKMCKSGWKLAQRVQDSDLDSEQA